MKFKKEQPGIFSLNRGWRFKEENISVLPPTKNHDDVYGFAKGGAAKGPADAGFDDSEWEIVELPHDWVTRKEFTKTGSPNQGYKERGTAWYRIRFEIPKEDAEKQLLLEFEGMSCDSEIYVNGSLLKRNFSGYNSFCVDMTDVANFGVIPNTLAVKINAEAWEGWWYEGAGIYRNVWLVKKEAVHIGYHGVFIKPVYISDGLWKLCHSTELENSFEFDVDYKIKTIITDSEGNEIASFEREGNVGGFAADEQYQSIMVSNPKLWSPETPYLYEARTEVYYDSKCNDYLVTKFGFRTIAINAEQGFFLNGKNIKIKGFCNHQDHAGVGVAVPYALKEYRVKLLKELGANAYRCAHNPDPEILEICDRIGLMVMEENRTFSSSTENIEQMKGIVKDARNHPSVIFYSVFNEEPLQGTGKGRRMAGRLQAAVKCMDDSRPVLGAFNGGYMEEEGASTILDVTGINYNPRRYDEFHTKYPDTPLLGSETASAFMVRDEYQNDMNAHILDNYDTECALWGNTVKEAWKYVNERPFVAGTFVWTGFDYRGEPTPFEWPSVGTFFGTYDSCGFEKDACYLYRAFWKKEPVVHIVSPWDMESEEGKNIECKIFTNCEEIELYINDRLFGRKKADLYEQVSFSVPYEKGHLKAVGCRSGEVQAQDIQITAGVPKRLILESSRDQIAEDGFDAAAVNIYAVDENGLVVRNSDAEIQFEIEGGAELIGVGNGNPNSHEPDYAPYRKLFHGKAQMIIKNKGHEKIIVKAFAKNIEGALLEIPVVKTEAIPYVEIVDERVVEGWKLYYQLFGEKPEANPEVCANDMNSFEPVEFSGSVQPQLSGQLGKYALYRTEIELRKSDIEKSLYFADVKGYVWVYMDGQELVSRTDSSDGYLFIKIPSVKEGKHVITVIIQNINKEWPQAGICIPVTIKN